MSSKTCILVIDDDPNAVQMLKLTLEAEGYQVATASSGGEALRKVRERKPDLAIVDVMMLGIDGYQVCRYLRNDPHTADLPVLILTARAGGRDHAKGFDSGADDYLTKPATPQEIVNRVKALLWFGGGG